MLKVVPDLLGQMNQSMHEPLNVRPELSLIVRQALGIHAPFQILVEVFLRVQLRGVARQPEQFQAVLMSGYPEADILPRFADLGLSGYLQKPFRMPALTALLQRVVPS